MGHPRFQRKKFTPPRHPWEADRIKEENQLIKEYGLKKKKEVWRAEEKLNNWQTQAKKIASLTEKEREIAEKILLTKLNRLGVLPDDADLDDVLELTVHNILERRLQTALYKKGMAHTPKHARQLIVHRKVTVNGKKMSSPSYFVKANDKLGFVSGFAFTPKQIKKEEIPRKSKEESEKMVEVKTQSEAKSSAASTSG
ncbi:30S ribosomal protein S4 [Candidatus Woesearchaeota archaeon]|nr:30S ribosomal protein S4 [Candidatus Woesearchaeota archaeon]